MWNGTYKKWLPIPEWCNCRVDIEAVHHDWEGFRIWLRHHDPTKGVLIVRFDSQLLYDSGAESDRIGEIQPKGQDLKFPHVFWTVEDSELISIFHRQSCGIRTNQKLNHFAFLACNQQVDVIALTPPTFGNPAG